MAYLQPDKPGKVYLPAIRTAKENGEKLVCLTAYDYPTARIVDEAGVDMILVGDSMGNVIHGYGNTIPVTMDEICSATKAVKRGSSRALVVADMPYGSYHTGDNKAVRNALTLMKDGGAMFTMSYYGANKVVSNYNLMGPVKAALEAIVHPAVHHERTRFIVDHGDKPALLFDIPLLFETGGAAAFDKVIVVSAPAAIQRERVLARDGMTSDKFAAILARLQRPFDAAYYISGPPPMLKGIGEAKPLGDLRLDAIDERARELSNLTASPSAMLERSSFCTVSR